MLLAFKAAIAETYFLHYDIYIYVYVYIYIYIYIYMYM